MKARILSNSRAALAILVAMSIVIGSFGLSVFQIAAAGAEQQPNTLSTPYFEGFDVGEIGSQVNNWTETAIEANLTKTTDSARAESFKNVNDLVIAEKDGNKVAAVVKTGGGYIAATSPVISVNAGTAYSFSFDYMNAYPTDVDGVEDRSKYYGIALLVGEYDAEGNETLTTLYQDYVMHNSWVSAKKDYIIKPTTEKLVVYLWSGSLYNYNITTYFDNVKINEVGHNFDFEAGAVGENVINWTETSVDNNTNTKTATDYTGSFELLNADDNGNQVLAVTKTGSGYIAATSLPYKVKGGEMYAVSFDYMLKEYSAKAGATNGLNYLGTRLLYEELDAEGNVIKSLGNATRLFATHVNVTAADTEWQKAKVVFTPSENAAAVVFYFYAGGQWNIYTTTYFDNLKVWEVGHNFDFEAGAVGENVVNWTETSVDNNTNTKTATDYTGSFELLNADDNGNQVLAVTKTGSGYIAATSLPYKVKGGEMYAVSFDYMLKEYSAKAGATNGLNYLGTRLLYEELDAEGNVIKSLGNATRLFATHVNVTYADTEWQKAKAVFTPSENAAAVVFYFYAGGQWNIYTTTYFDNLKVWEVGHNFDFEAGAVGENAVNWTETSVDNNTNTKTSTDYTGSFELLNADDNGNQVLAVKKTGSGYIAATSLPYKVEAGAKYQISFDYMLKEYSAKANATNGLNYLGTRLLYEELDAEGNVIKSLGNATRLFATHVDVTVADTEWNHASVEYTAGENADSVIFYLYVGGQWNIYSTTYYDDLTVTQIAPAPEPEVSSSEESSSDESSSEESSSGESSSEESSSAESSSEESSSGESSSEESSSAESSSEETSSDAVSSEPEVNYGPNLDFEEGTVGEVTPSWTKTPMTNGGLITNEPSYLNSYSLTTVYDNGNKVLSVSKSGSGYIGATSVDIPVISGKTYIASALYKQVSFDIGSATSGINDMNNRLYIGEKNAAGDITLTKNIHGGTGSDWNELSLEFTTRSDTVSVVIYLWVGAQWNVKKTVYFDNVTLTEKPLDTSSEESSSEESSSAESSSEESSSSESSSEETSSDSTSSEPEINYGPNLDFEEGIVGEVTPSWTKTPMTQNGKFSDEASYLNSYTFTTVLDGGNKVLSVSKNGSGYIGAASKMISVNANTAYVISALYKQVEFDIGSNTVGIQDMSTRIYIEEYNSGGTGEITAYTSGGMPSDWTKLSASLTTKEDTVAIKVYLWVGAQWNVNKTVYFDDITVEEAGLNLDFEAGSNGSPVFGWTETAMNANLTFVTDSSTANTFVNNNKLVTLVEANGNKVAAVEKTGAGYIAATSGKIGVTAGKTYKLSVDYMTAFPTDVDGTEDRTKYNGVGILVGLVDANGEITLKTLKLDYVFHNNWEFFEGSFKTTADTENIIVYLWSGSVYNYNITTYFDNVTITQVESDDTSSDDTSSDNDSSEDTGSDSEPDDDYSDEHYGYNYDFEEGKVGERTPSWKKTSMTQIGKFSEDDYSKSFSFITANDNGNKVLAVIKSGAGYIGATSKVISVSSSSSYTVSVKYKQVGLELKHDTLGIQDMGTRLYIGEVNANGDITISNVAYGGNEANWTDLSVSFKTKEDTVQMIVYLWVGAQWNVNKTVYFDDVEVFKDNIADKWTPESCKESGIPRDDDFTSYYGISSLRTGKDAFKLFVKRNEGVLGGVVFYSDKIPVIAGENYTTSFNSKIEGSRKDRFYKIGDEVFYTEELTYIDPETNEVKDTTEVNLFGASYVLRWLDKDGNPIGLSEKNYPVDLTGRRLDNIDWTYYEYEVTAPAGAVAVQIGLVIGGYSMNHCSDLTYSYENVVFLESDAHDAYTEDPEIIESPLYKQSILFVGDEIGSALSVKAKEYSRMKVTNLCGDNDLKSQFESLLASKFNYLIISIGNKEIKNNIPLGVVNGDAFLGTDFDTATFAGLLDQAFAYATEYVEAERIIYVLPTNIAEYRTLAEVVAAKWGITLIVLENSENTENIWKEIIPQVENSVEFDCYAFDGLVEYLTQKAEEVSVLDLSLENKAVLTRILSKANGCPRYHEHYNKYASLIGKVTMMLVQYKVYNPEMLGATIANGDPNRIGFIAKSPQKPLGSNTKVINMGVLVISDDTLSTRLGAELVKGNEFVTEISSLYSKANVKYYSDFNSASLDPDRKYSAIAFIIYEENGKQYICYSENDYSNEFGINTAEKGICTRSVYGISKDIALNLVNNSKDKLDYTAIDGEVNKKYLIENSENGLDFLYDVYRFVCYNAVKIINLFN